MPKLINPVRKAKLKEGLLKGKDAKTAMLEAGFAPATAHNSTTQSIVKQCLNEIGEELKASEITVEFVLRGLLKEYQSAQKSSDRQNALMLLGKYLAMFKDRSENTNYNINEDKRTELDSYYQQLVKGRNLS